MIEHKEKLSKLVETVNSNNWIEALEAAREWRNSIESVLLMRYCVPNEVSKDFDLLLLRLRKNTPGYIKSREIREAIAKILDKISVYGLSTGRFNGRNGRSTSRTIENLLRIIESEMLDLSVLSNRNLISDLTSKAHAILEYVNTLEDCIKSINDRRKEVMQMIEHALSEIALFKSELNKLAAGKGDLSEYRGMVDAVSKVARVLSSPDYESVVKVFEDRTGFAVEKGVKEPEVEERERFEKELPKIETEVTGKLDWIDEDWEQVLEPPKSILIIGHRGMGKSCLGWALLEYYAVKHKMKAYLVNAYAPKQIPPNKLSVIPNWVSVVNSPADIPSNSVILYDEAYAKYHARKTMGSETPVMDALLELSRQKRHCLIWITQQSSKIDVNIVYSIDVLIVKNTNELRVRAERDIIKEISKKALKAFSKVKNKKEYAYVHDFSQNQGFLKKNGMPSFWSEELSRLYEGW